MDLRHRFNDAKPINGSLRNDMREFSRPAWREQPQEANGTRANEPPLISTDVLDVPNQRALMAAIFVIIQASLQVI